MIGAVVTGTFFAILLLISLILICFIKALSTKCLDNAYRMYLLENGYKQPTKDEIQKYYKEAVQSLNKNKPFSG